MREFIHEIKDYGPRIALGNQLIHFTKWFVGAKSIRLAYWPVPRKRYTLDAVVDLIQT